MYCPRLGSTMTFQILSVTSCLTVFVICLWLIYINVLRTRGMCSLFDNYMHVIIGWPFIKQKMAMTIKYPQLLLCIINQVKRLIFQTQCDMVWSKCNFDRDPVSIKCFPCTLLYWHTLLVNNYFIWGCDIISDSCYCWVLKEKQTTALRNCQAVTNT
jgi:hypothetical protein